MLTTRRPTPTTVLYTISTRASTTNLPARLLSALNLFLRVGTGLLILATLLHEYHHSTLSGTFLLLDRLHSALYTTRAGASLLALPVFESTPRPYRLAVAAGATYLVLRRFHTAESLLVIRGLGVQTSTSSPYYLGASSTRFIPTSSIQDIFVHEAFRGFEVRYYLSIVVEGEEDVVVVFPKILPRREVLEAVWRGARACLYEPKT